MTESTFILIPEDDRPLLREIVKGITDLVCEKGNNFSLGFCACASMMGNFSLHVDLTPEAFDMTLADLKKQYRMTYNQKHEIVDCR